MTLHVTAADARALAIRAQGLAGRRHSDPRRLLRSLAAIQLDTISVLARSHELVCHARLRSVSRPQLERAFWGPRSGVFEYWAHAACLLPVETWPSMAWRRRRSGERWLRRAEGNSADHDEVLSRLRDLGPVTTADLDGARRAPGWWEWSPLKRAVEELLAVGEVVCVERRGWRRVYDLPERAIPAELLTDPSDDVCTAQLVAIAAACLGVATVDDLADYFRLPIAWVRKAVVGAGLVPATVEGWGAAAWVDPAALAGLGGSLRHRPVLLSPFDSLIWHRPRTQRLFEFRHRLEAYTPSAQREHGYFVMPLLAAGRLVGRVDPKREGSTLVARRVSVEVGSVAALATALVDAAAWVDCDRVVVGPEVEQGLASALRSALGAYGAA